MTARGDGGAPTRAELEALAADIDAGYAEARARLVLHDGRLAGTDAQVSGALRQVDAVHLHATRRLAEVERRMDALHDRIDQTEEKYATWRDELLDSLDAARRHGDRAILACIASTWVSDARSGASS